MESKVATQFVKTKHYMNDWFGILLGFLIAFATTLMSIIDFTSLSAGSPFKSLTLTQYIFLAISIVVKGFANMYIFRSFIKNGIEKGKREQDYEDHLDYQDEQITKCLPYRAEIDIKCEEDNYKEKRIVYSNYCNHNRIVFEDLFNEDLTVKMDYVPKNKQEKKAIKNLYRNCYINEISTALLFDSAVGGWQKNSKTLLEKEYISKNSSTTIGMLFGALTSILSVAPFYFSASGIVMAIVNFGIVIGLAWYKYMNAITYVKDELGGEIKRRGLKLETFYIEIKKDIVKNEQKNDIILKEESKEVSVNGI